MSTFTALNLEPEDDSEDEIDDTKEIQLEEAFKLYQNALKLHSQGSQYYSEASGAYDELFRSEVFKYPEIVSEFAKDEHDTAATESAVLSEAVSLSLVPADTADSSHNSLPQLVYLAFKNRGQFALDVAHSHLKDDSASRDHDHWLRISASGQALKDFADALERDDTDLDLWRKAARVAEVSSSQRIARFCLESVVAGDEPEAGEIELSGLDEAFAATEVKEVLTVLNDDLSLSQNSELEPKGSLQMLMKNRLDPYPFLPKRKLEFEYPDERRRPLAFMPAKRIIHSSGRSWLAVGQSLLQTLIGEQQNAIDLGPGAAIYIEIPKAPNVESEVNMMNVDDTVAIQQLESELAAASELVRSPEKLDDLNSEPPVAEASADDHVMFLSAQEQADHDTTNGNSHNANDESKGEDMQPHDSASLPLPTRKRSSTQAGIDEAGEAGRVKSKRLRARESNADAIVPEQEVKTNLTQFFEDQIQELRRIDRWLFEVLGGLLAKIGVQGQLVATYTGDANPSHENGSNASNTYAHQNLQSQAASDLEDVFVSWNEEKASAILYGHGNNDFGSGQAGLTLFLEHSKPISQRQHGNAESLVEENVEAFVLANNSAWPNLHQATFRWLERLLQSPIAGDLDNGTQGASPLSSTSAYMRTLWPDDLKQTVVQMIVREDEYLCQTMQDRLFALEEKILQHSNMNQTKKAFNDAGDMELTQTVFELHLDVYSLITNPSSQVDQMTRVQQQDRLNRWAGLAGGFINHYANHPSGVAADDPFVLRFIWASTTYATKAEKVVQEHVMLCLRDLQSLLSRAGNPTIILPNNAAMPEISASAVQQEISRLTTLDFFTSIFDSDSSNPVGTIESLEPILEPSSDDSELGVAGPGDNENGQLLSSSRSTADDSLVLKLKEFLSAGDASLKLFLWRRLRDAYQAIDYPPKVVSCYLRAIESIVQELQNKRHTDSDDGDRKLSLLKWLKDSDDLVVKLLQKVLNDPKAFEYLDEAHFRSSTSAVAQLSKTLHSFALYEDRVRFGLCNPPAFRSSSATKAFEKVKDRLREMQIRLWTLQYTLIKEAVAQNKDVFPDATDDLAKYLRAVHQAMGMRHYCKYSSKVLIKLMKTELLSAHTEEGYSADLAQVLYDLHQLKLTPGVGDIDHGCTPEPLDKKTAIQLIEVVMVQARRLNIKDLIKSELKGTIEKLQQTIGLPKPSPVVSHNKKIISAYLKSPVNPRELYRCIKGIGDLATRPVRTDTAKIADQGWYFLLGHIALARFKSVKRVNPTPTDDLDVAITFLRQDLEYGVEKWETWYCLAQVYDAKIEDDLLWTADKINNHRQELATIQRNAIHAYAMAAATCIRLVDVQPEVTSRISEMYAAFAMRLYASSREPLTMDAFKSDLHQKFFSGGVHQLIYKALPFAAMQPYAVWNFASYLLRRSLIHKSKSWTSHYMLGKCLWKMFNTPVDEQGKRKVEIDQVLEPFMAAVEALPERKDNRSDYILEPHFKLVSIVHKLVHRKILTPAQGQEALQATPYARKVHLSEDEDGPEWEPYVHEILKKLGHADKSNWHHRIIARAAHVIYDGQPGIAGALGAKHEFTQQIFTKTMTLQVWKPENERAGRHFVYTSRYVKFFVELLSQINDRANFDLLVRRIRRKPTEHLNHQNVWEEIVVTYVKLLRRTGKVPEGHEKAVFENLNHDEFTTRSEQAEKWAHDPDTTSTVLDILRDAIELKKLNNSLMKGTLIDDLISDTYALMYESFVSQMPKDDQQPMRGPMDPLVNIGNVPSAAQVGDDNRDRMRLGNVLMSQADGAADSDASRPASSPAVPVGLGFHSTPGFMGIPLPNLQSSIASLGPVAIPKPVRVKPITRREIQRKAEGVVVRPPPIKTPILTKKPIVVEVPPPSRDYRGLTIANLNGEPTNDEQGAIVGTRVDGLIKDDAGASSELSSRRGSVHDSADDESELSDIDEHYDTHENRFKKPIKIAKPLFPGLIGTAEDTPEAEDDDVDSTIAASDAEEKMDVDENGSGDANAMQAVDPVGAQ